MVKESENAKQFAQFFPTLTVPVCYILGMNAQPLEVFFKLDFLKRDLLNLLCHISSEFLYIINYNPKKIDFGEKIGREVVPYVLRFSLKRKFPS